MKKSSKAKSLLVIIVFLSMLLMPVLYIWIKDHTGTHTEMPAALPANK